MRLGAAPVLRQFARQGSREMEATARPTRLLEACRLLNLPAATAMLLHDSVDNFDSLEDAKDALAEHGVKSLSPSMARQILTNRLDIAVM